MDNKKRIEYNKFMVNSFWIGTDRVNNCEINRLQE